MSDVRECRTCKRVLPVAEFHSAHNLRRPAQVCGSCRGGTTPQTPSTTAGAEIALVAPAPAAADRSQFLAAYRQVCAQLDSLQASADLVLERFQTSAPPTAAAQPSASAISQNAVPAVQPSSLQQPVGSGEMDRPLWEKAFPWLTAELVEKVFSAELTIQELPELADRTSSLILDIPEYTMADVYESHTVSVDFDTIRVISPSAAFLRAVPNVGVFSHLFLTYSALRASATQDPLLYPGLSRFHQRVLDHASRHSWPVVAEYIRRVCGAYFYKHMPGSVWIRVAEYWTPLQEPEAPPRQTRSRRRGRRGNKRDRTQHHV